jgi:alkanesulfonate monooxygenase SsuD/methylene tetrahydromethanopterin reductase-like flavin-dependent oxidoreductase (luciferase family)
LLPLHDPLRLAEELAMLDCMSNGRIVSGFARGIPREHNVYGVSLADSRARFEEAWEIIYRAWTEEVFSYQGRFWSYRDVAIWPRPAQQPHPPVWVPVTGSKETIEWAGRHNIPITPGLAPIRALREDIIRYYAACLTRHGHRLTPDHLIIQASAYVADSKARADHRGGRSRRRGDGAGQHESRRDAAGDVPRAGAPVREQGVAGAAGPRRATGAPGLALSRRPGPRRVRPRCAA